MQPVLVLSNAMLESVKAHSSQTAKLRAQKGSAPGLVPRTFSPRLVERSVALYNRRVIGAHGHLCRVPRYLPIAGTHDNEHTLPSPDHRSLFNRVVALVPDDHHTQEDFVSRRTRWHRSWVH